MQFFGYGLVWIRSGPERGSIFGFFRSGPTVTGGQLTSQYNRSNGFLVLHFVQIFYLIGFGLFCLEIILSLWVLQVTIWTILALIFSLTWHPSQLFSFPLLCVCAENLHPFEVWEELTMDTVICLPLLDHRCLHFLSFPIFCHLLWGGWDWRVGGVHGVWSLLLFPCMIGWNKYS